MASTRMGLGLQRPAPKGYSAERVSQVLDPQVQLLENGAVGIDFHQLSAPGHLANSAVLRMLAEEERQRGGTAKGLKRVAWPPPPENQGEFIEEQPVYSKGAPGYGQSFASSLSQAAPTPWEPPAPIASPPRPAAHQQASPQPEPVYAPPPTPFFEPPPTTVVLRPEPPISQAPPPVFISQPAATKAVGSNMRGDEKWPPADYKARAQAENEARVALARGPAVRPRKVKRDYTNFFAQNALTPNYPSYKAPPGTQHYVEEGTSNF